MNYEVFPRSYRVLVWIIALAVAALIILTGYISVQVAGIEQEVNQLRSTM